MTSHQIESTPLPRHAMSHSVNLPPTRIASIQVENFRCFASLPKIHFHPSLTVFVAPNGGGKTAILEAILFGWRFFIRGMELVQTGRVFAEHDGRIALAPDGTMQPVKPISIEAECWIDSKSANWGIQKGKKTRTSTLAAEPIRAMGEIFRREIQDFADKKKDIPPSLPVFGFYGTGRLWAPQKITASRRKRVRPDTSRSGAYHECLSPNSHFGLFEVWFVRYSLEALQEQSNGTRSPHLPAEKLKAVVQAVDALLQPTGWHSLSYDAANEIIVADHPQYGRLPVSLLSDGIRMMIGLVGDIAHRCARLNPQYGAAAAKKTHGVIMIDEVDMHLHPAWQQIVVQSLCEAFPLIQFILTTHSPQVLTTIRKEHIRVLTHEQVAEGTEGRWRAEPPERSPLAQESADALAFVMNVRPRPPLPLLADLHTYEQLARAGKADANEARAALARLTAAGFEFNQADLALFAFLADKQKNLEEKPRG